MQPSLVKRNLLFLKILNVAFLFKETNIVFTDTLVQPRGACSDGNWITKHSKQNTAFVIFLNWSSFPLCPSTNSTKQLDMEVS